MHLKHCVKSVCTRSFSGPYFPGFGHFSSWEIGRSITDTNKFHTKNKVLIYYVFLIAIHVLGFLK